MKKLNLTTLAIVILFVSIAGQAQMQKPKTVRDFFMLLPGNYFSIECCPGKSMKESKIQYLKQYLDVEDTANGFMKGGGDGAQDAFEMALFKRPNGSYIIGFYTIGEGDAAEIPLTVFLEYKRGKWANISRAVIPSYAPKKFIYRLPQKGTTIKVFRKDEAAGDFNKGGWIYDLLWKNGKFTISRVRY